MDETGKNPSDTKMTDIKTSQTEFSAPEGKSGGSAGGSNVYGDEMAPTGISTKVAMSQENQLKTSQMIKGEFSLCESPES